MYVLAWGIAALLYCLGIQALASDWKRERAEDTKLQKEWATYKEEFEKELLPCARMFHVDGNIQVPVEGEKISGIIWFAEGFRPKYYKIEGLGKKEVIYAFKLAPTDLISHKGHGDDPYLRELWREYEAKQEPVKQVLREDYSLSTKEKMKRLEQYLVERLDLLNPNRDVSTDQLVKQLVTSCGNVTSKQVKQALDRAATRLGGKTGTSGK